MRVNEQPVDTLLTVVIPTRNEAGNIAPLVRRLDECLGESPAEILFVDDSDDDTPERITEVARESVRPVRLLHRPAGQRCGGLGSAVLSGLRLSRSTWAVVMDGDLQHPPELVPTLVRTGESAAADLVVASRYTGAGEAKGLDSAVRVLVSSGTTRLAKATFPRRLSGCSDPMSGFFAVRLSSLELDRLRPNGFKILLEILARSPRLKIAEAPFTFAERHSGESKASWREGLLFARRLCSLRMATVVRGRGGPESGAWRGGLAARVGGFAGVGFSGVAVNSVALWALVEMFHAPLLLAAAIATQASTAWNFLLTDRFVFAGPKARRPWPRFTGFALLNNALLVGRLPLLAWLVHSAGMGYVLANVVTLIVAFAARFILSDRYLFAPGEIMTSTARTVPEFATPEDGAATAPRGMGVARSGPVDVVIDLREISCPPVRRLSEALPWRYDIHGIVTIASVARLRELDYFSTDADAGPCDIEIHRGELTSAHTRGRARVTQYAALPAVSYEEHLGRHGSDFFLDMTGNIQVFVGPMLVRSPHVLYTNVVEALLRFVLVSRGYMLLHSACLELGGRGVLMSALTDTGKTGTVLRLLRENASKFLSDDMTIIDPFGTAFCYPKPLTISQHTLRAVNAGDLTAKEWRRLRVQSRLHSKEGRGIGTRLGEMNLPIMSLNAATQYVVPPPKYVVERLVPCEWTTSVRIEDLFIIERSTFRLSEIDRDALLDELIANTDDAYGFPPFRYFAPALVVGATAYEELRSQERKILDSALRGIRARRLATPDFSWADHIPHLIKERIDTLNETSAFALRPMQLPATPTSLP
jgi:dolichol-phosphate mannosyltransferase